MSESPWEYRHLIGELWPERHDSTIRPFLRQLIARTQTMAADVRKDVWVVPCTHGAKPGCCFIASCPCHGDGK